MNLTTDKVKQATVLCVKEDRLDAHNSGELKHQVLKILNESGPTLIVDLSQVQFIDSSGLGALLSGYKNASLRARAFALAAPQPRVRSMFELTRLDRVFDIHPTVQSALGR